ncbi:amino acid racemase [Haloarculaceae archaeon H-GB11]|nr:amino acid racemase [Haloarculaceae archaeon H-GB11]
MSEPGDDEEGEPTLGVLGGMGPDATVNFMSEVVAKTPAARDKDHIETVVYNDPKIPDRNKAILEGAESPLPRMIRNAQRLESMGVDIIALPCNTAHYFYDDLAASVDIEIIHMIERTRERLEAQDLSAAGLLATSTVMETELYRDVFRNSTVDLVYPNQTDRLMEAIYAVKEGRWETASEVTDSVVSEFKEQGLEAVIVGCTDLSVLSSDWDLSAVDPTEILAEECVEAVQ